MSAPTTTQPGALKSAAKKVFNGVTDHDESENLKVERWLSIAFFPGRTERSPEYQEGCRAALEHHLVRRRISAPYVAGCAAADAFAAGVDEGHVIWRRQTQGAVQ